MARKRAHAAHENHERWLISYADFITLLFALFVVMFASSQTDKSKAQQVSDSVRNALDHGAADVTVHQVLGGTVDDLGKGNAMMRGPGGYSKTAPPVKAAVKAAAEAVRTIQVTDLTPSMKYTLRRSCPGKSRMERLIFIWNPGV